MELPAEKVRKYWFGLQKAFLRPERFGLQKHGDHEALLQRCRRLRRTAPGSGGGKGGGAPKPAEDEAELDPHTPLNPRSTSLNLWSVSKQRVVEHDTLQSMCLGPRGFFAPRCGFKFPLAKDHSSRSFRFSANVI